jgi:hypothetical protein
MALGFSGWQWQMPQTSGSSFSVPTVLVGSDTMNSSGGFVGESTSIICGSAAGSGAGSKSAPFAGLCFFLGLLPLGNIVAKRLLYSGQWSIGKVVLPEAAAE